MSQIAPIHYWREHLKRLKEDYMELDIQSNLIAWQIKSLENHIKNMAQREKRNKKVNYEMG